MNKKTRILFAASIFANIMFVFIFIVNALLPATSLDLEENTNTPEPLSVSVDNVQQSTEHSEVYSEESELIVHDISPSLESGYERFSIDDVNFELACEYTLNEGNLNAKEAAKFALVEYKRVFPNEILSDTFYALYMDSDDSEDPPTWYFYTQNEIEKPLFMQKQFVVHAISGEVHTMIIPLQNSINNAFSSKTPWISNIMLINIFHSSDWISISKDFLLTTFSCNDKISLSRPNLYWESLGFGLVSALYNMEISNVVTPVMVYIDVKTKTPIGYSFMRKNETVDYLIPIDESTWELFPELTL